MGSERLIESFTQTINVIILITLIHVEILLCLAGQSKGTVSKI